ncbi:hypothetical protein C8A05DRAFT_40741 [Staphylotrichum tortipilum]|uniref:Leucine rich repeat domain containing protein n=1 Tax=Staphylotrichum tortipilum TaxID=2831512 RepID=A0AAN6RXJ1_9PEZI|nr:hypothetical protein C8A05DRAFT_40741 [Staphylotrichum longicolle]
MDPADEHHRGGLLPSYREATEPLDWLALVAPYVPSADLSWLCLVSRRFYHHCTVDLDCVARFLEHARGIRPVPNIRTASPTDLVCSFDPRRLTADDTTATAAALAQCAYGRPALASGILSIASRFPRLRCLLLDGLPGIEPEALLARLPADPPRLIRPPLLLSLARCQVELPPAFFASFYLRDLVYLDLSDMPGSLGRTLAQRTLSPDQLPSLRILKAQGREMDNATACLLFKIFRTQLWSVDLGRNRVTEGMFNYLREVSFPERSMRTGDFAVEGRILYPLGHPSEGGGSASFGRFCFVTESEWSRTFSHPHRHLADAPPYTAHAYDGAQPPSVEPRLNGRAKARLDTPDAIKTMFSGTVSHPAPPLESVQALGVCRGHEGITHLHLNGNRISAAALAKLIRSSPGQLQHLECDSLSFSLPDAAPAPSWLSRARLSGILGGAHLFRPVFSANLQALRVHHSLVTQLPTLELDGSPPLSPLESLWAAETLLLPRVELAYPEAFVPDMNPRLQSLVLTHIPRWSTGPLAEQLISFLRLASAQERAIQDARAACRRAPATVRGLRHVRLEFAPDPREEGGLDGDSDSDAAAAAAGFDAAAVMDDSSKEFSFFGESNWSSTKPVTTTVNTPRPSARSASPHTPSPSSSPTPHLPNQPSYPQLWTDPVPASPCHVAAGVPEGLFLFGAAWGSILCPVSSLGFGPTPRRGDTSALPKPTQAELKSMRDVLEEVKAYRAQTRRAYDEEKERTVREGGREDGVRLGAPHFHWMGRLEVVLGALGVGERFAGWRCGV